MRKTLAIAILILPPCAGPAYVARTPVPPAAPPSRVVQSEVGDTADEAVTQAWLRDEVARQRGGSTAPGDAAPEPTSRAPLMVRTQPRPADTTNGEATSSWFDRTISERRAANPDQPPVPIVQTVEHTVYVDRPVYYRDGWDDGDRYGYPHYRHSRYGYSYDDCGVPLYHGRYHRSTFPVNTAIGAGLGAIIGRRSHHSGRGAAIGAGIGLLLDLAR